MNQVDNRGDLIGKIQQVKNNVDGAVNFDDIIYTQADMGKTYYYQVSEINDNNAGYSYDLNIYTFIIKVIDNGDGTLRTNKTILKGSTNVTEAEFVNTYTTSDVSLQFVANKTMTGRVLEEAQFSYKLAYLGEDGKSNTTIQKVTNNSNGEISFAPITYTQADMGKVYVYTLKEINEAKPGYEYDNTVYTIEVKVIDNGDGTLKTEVSTVKPGDGTSTVPVIALTFSNVYTAKSSVHFIAKKVAVGSKLTNQQISFVLADKDGNILQTVYNDADENIIFNDIFFNQNQLGEYHYKMYEISDNNKAYTYDKTVYLLTVTVTDNGDGTLSTVTSFVKENGSENNSVQSIKFLNQYHTQANPANPETGDYSSMFHYCLLALSSATILILTKRRRKISY